MASNLVKGVLGANFMRPGYVGIIAWFILRLRCNCGVWPNLCFDCDSDLACNYRVVDQGSRGCVSLTTSAGC